LARVVSTRRIDRREERNKNEIARHGVFPEEASGFAGALSESYIALRQRYGPVGIVFPKSPEGERGLRGGGEQLGSAGNLGLGLPAEELGRQKECEAAQTASEPSPSKTSGLQGAKAQ